MRSLDQYERSRPQQIDIRTQPPIDISSCSSLSPPGPSDSSQTPQICPASVPGSPRAYELSPPLRRLSVRSYVFPRAIVLQQVLTSIEVFLAFSSRFAFSSGDRISRPLASLVICLFSSSVSSASCNAAFISRARLICPMMGTNRSPPNIAPNTSSGSTKPP